MLWVCIFLEMVFIEISCYLRYPSWCFVCNYEHCNNWFWCHWMWLCFEGMVWVVFFFYIYYQFVSVRKFELLSGCSFLGKSRWELFDHGIKMCKLWTCNRSLCRDQWGPHQLITLAKFCCIVHYRSTLWVIEAQLCQDSLS